LGLYGVSLSATWFAVLLLEQKRYLRRGWKMKVSELRIGNLAFDDEGILSEVIGFKPYDHSVRCDEEEGCIILVDLHPKDNSVRRGYETNSLYTKPIPLTEEWLVRFGFYVFKYQEDNFGWIKNGVNISKYFNFVLMYPNGDYYDSIKIQHVHQLQNLYCALTGEELKYD